LAGAIALLVISLGALLAGRGYIKTARRMRLYRTTRGRVVGRELATVGGDTREGRWGQGGGYRPKVTYEYTVDGVGHTSDRTSYAHRGFKKAIAEQQLAAIPDDVDVYYDPDSPEVAYLTKHNPRMGYWFLTGGTLGVLIALVVAFG
jgi:hypothetical protein